MYIKATSLNEQEEQEKLLEEIWKQINVKNLLYPNNSWLQWRHEAKHLRYSIFYFCNTKQNKKTSKRTVRNCTAIMSTSSITLEQIMQNIRNRETRWQNKQISEQWHFRQRVGMGVCNRCGKIPLQGQSLAGIQRIKVKLEIHIENTYLHSLLGKQH